MDDLLWKLPLFDDLFYSMQGQNIMMVDVYLRDLEESLLEDIINVSERRSEVRCSFRPSVRCGYLPRTSY